MKGADVRDAVERIARALGLARSAQKNRAHNGPGFRQAPCVCLFPESPSRGNRDCGKGWPPNAWRPRRPQRTEHLRLGGFFHDRSRLNGRRFRRGHFHHRSAAAAIRGGSAAIAGGAAIADPVELAATRLAARIAANRFTNRFAHRGSASDRFAHGGFAARLAGAQPSQQTAARLGARIATDRLTHGRFASDRFAHGRGARIAAGGAAVKTRVRGGGHRHHEAANHQSHHQSSHLFFLQTKWVLKQR